MIVSLASDLRIEQSNNQWIAQMRTFGGVCAIVYVRGVGQLIRPTQQEVIDLLVHYRRRWVVSAVLELG